MKDSQRHEARKKSRDERRNEKTQRGRRRSICTSSRVGRREREREKWLFCTLVFSSLTLPSHSLLVHCIDFGDRDEQGKRNKRAKDSLLNQENFFLFEQKKKDFFL